MQVYYADPLAYVSRRIWIDDFIKLKNSYDGSKLLGYMNNFLFAEEKGYHRFTPILASLLQEWQSEFDSQMTNDYTESPQFDLSALSQSDALWKLYQSNFAILSWMSFAGSGDLRTNLTKPTPIFLWSEQWWVDFTSAFNQENDRIKTIIQESKSHNEQRLWSPDYNFFRKNSIPTKFLGVTILKYFYPYDSLFSNTYLNNIYENTDAGGRYLNSKLWAWEVDTHMRYTVLKDTTSIVTIKDLNSLMEQALDRKIEKERYSMHIPLLDLAKTYKKCPIGSCLSWDKLFSNHLLRWYEQFFFGKNALDIIDASETTIFRWSFANITDLTGAKKSPLFHNVLWGSYGDLAKTETACYYAYHLEKPLIDSDQAESQYCGKKTKKVARYKTYTWWNMTPLNINPNAQNEIRTLEPKIDLMLARNPSFNKSMWRPNFDLPSCVMTSGDFLFGKTDDSADGYDQWGRVDFSYSGYSDTYLGAEYFGSLTRVQTSNVLCALENTSPCSPSKKAIHPDDQSQLYDSNFFTVIEKIIPEHKTANKQNRFMVHAKKWFFTTTLPWWFFYNTPVVENNQPIYEWENLLGMLKFQWMPIVYSGDTYPTSIPTFVYVNDIPPWTVFGEHKYQTFADGKQCTSWSYKKVTQYFYKTIDSRVYHKSPTDLEIGAMNTSTLARPVDDPRYISFKGIGWSTVRLLYPNLYETPIEWWNGMNSIREAIVAYLRQKANEHRAILQQELEWSQIEYQLHQTWYDFLWTVDPIAVPWTWNNRPYTLIDEDFYMRALGSTGLTMAAENIYYQLRNWTGYTNQTFETIWEQLKWMKNNFNLNDKISYVVWSYLTHDPKESDPWINKIRKMIIGINDWYRPQWYEIAVINSDGNDSLLKSNILSSKYPKGVNREIQNNLDGWAGNGWTVLDIGQNVAESWQIISWILTWIDTGSIAHDILCGDQKYGSVVSLGKRPGALKCRLEETLRNPISLTVNFKSAKWPVIDSQIHQWYTKDWSIWDYAQITDKTQKLGWSDWMHISNTRKQYVGKELENTNMLLHGTQSDIDFAHFVENNIILQHTSTVIDLSTTVESISWNYTHFITLGTRGNILPSYEDLEIRIYSTGDNCIKVFDQQQCEDYVFTPDFTKPIVIPFEVWNTKVWHTVIDIGICISWKSCYYKTVSTEIMSSIVDHVEFKIPADIVTTNYQTPLILFAYDKYGNRVYHTSDQYRITINGGKLLQWPTLFNNFNEAIYLFLPQKNGTITLQKKRYSLLDLHTGAQELYDIVDSKKFDVKQPQILPWFSPLSSLPPYTYFHPISIGRLWSIPGNEYQYLMIKGIPWWLLEVESLDGLFEPWVFKISSGIASPSFFATRDFEIKDYLTIPLRPTYKAWSDRIRIRMKYDDGSVLEKIIGTSIKPWFPYKIHLNEDHKIIPRWSSVTGLVTITDMYGNIADMSVSVFMTTQIPLCVPGQCPQAIPQDGITFGAKSISGTWEIQFDTYRGPKEWMWWQAIAQLKMLWFGSETKIFSQNWWLSWEDTINQTGIWYPKEQVNLTLAPQWWEQTNISLTVEYKWMESKQLWPIEHLNVMYLTLMWNNRAKDQKKIFAKSNKILGLTTLLSQDDIVQNTYKSIENSNDIWLDIWMREDFRHITSFSQWHTVWESTRWFASYRLINYGDPVLSRIDKNRTVEGSPYDAGVGKFVNSYPGKVIKKTDEVDFDGDGLWDIIVTFTDGVVRLLKSYLKHPIPWTPAQYHDIWPIARIGDGLIEVKTNPDGLFLRSSLGKVRRYPISNRKMPVDGDLICLDIPWWPEFVPVDRVPYIEFVDYDKKEWTDILTSDYLGKIMVTYAQWSSNPIDNPVQDITPIFLDIVSNSISRTTVSQSWWLILQNISTPQPYLYKITISHPDPLQFSQKDFVYIKNLWSLLHTKKLRYIIDISDGWRKTSLPQTAWWYYTDNFDNLSGIQAIFEDLPYTPEQVWWHSYISQNKFYCDRWRKYRQHQPWGRIIVEQASISVGWGNDQSLAAIQSHDNSNNLAWYNTNPQKDGNDADATIYQSQYSWLVDYPSTTDRDTLFLPLFEDVEVPVLQWPKTKEWYTIQSPIPWDSTYYCPISICKSWVFKSVWWAIKPWDYATVKVWFWETISRYIENIQWPWKILRQSDGKPLNFRMKKNSEMLPYFDDLPWWYVLYVDNIQPSDRFTYTVQYVWVDLYNISTEYLNCDQYPDIKVAGKNGCNKMMNYYLNQWNSFVKKQFDLVTFLTGEWKPENEKSNEMLDIGYKTTAMGIKNSQTTESSLLDYNFGEEFVKPFAMINNLFESNNTGFTVPVYIPLELDWLSSSTISDNSTASLAPLNSSTTSDAEQQNQISQWSSSLSISNTWWSLWWNSVYAQNNNTENVASSVENAFTTTERFIDTANEWSNYGVPEINLGLSQATTKNLQKTIDKTLNDMCNGFQIKAGGKCPKPFALPFNMAFLAPGTYNFMGKKLMDDKWLPIFFFPGTLFTPVPVPIPYWLKTVWTDDFYRAGWWSIPSFIRIYLAPTTTLWLWLWLCFGLDKQLRVNLKKPFKDIVGNCLAFATDLKRQCTELANAWWIPSVDDNTWARSYPIEYSRKSNYNTSRAVIDLLLTSACLVWSPKEQNVQHVTSSDGSLVQQFSHINEDMDDNDVRSSLQQSAATDMINGIETNLDVTEKQGIKIQKATEFANQIKWWASVGLMPAIQRRIEQQIEYIINNAFHLDIKIYTPNLASLTDGFKQVWDFKDIYQWTKNTQKQLQANWSSITSDTNLWFSRLGWEKLTTTLSNYVSNPFDAIAQAFEDVSLFRFEQRDIQLKLPMIYSEDISRYISYSKGWLMNQKKIWEQWQQAFQSCKQWSWFQKLKNCEFIETRAIKIQSAIVQFEKSIKQNISTLESYRDIPGQLTQYLNVHERYLAEVTETYGWLVSTVTKRMNENSIRFEKWVEAMVLLVGIIKTRQIIPDFAINWTQKCSKCTVDTYGYLSDSRWSLTPTLPLLPIPPFRIPDIILDLSKINVWLTISLPHFIIVPTRVPLPQLPDLPSPFAIDLSAPNIALPIPEIPQIPLFQLPPFDLPSFTPQIDLTLPMLPPAVKIPKINPGIRTIVKLIEFLWNLVCIYKRWFGIVGETSLKTKIEQMTQRTMDIFPFDGLINLAPLVPLKWYDIRVDTFVNFAFNFEWVFDVFKEMADSVNKVSDQITSTMARSTDVINQWPNRANSLLQTIPSNIQFNYDYKLEDYTIVRSEMLSDLRALTWSIVPLDIQTKMSAVGDIITTPSHIALNITWFITIADQWKAILSSKTKEIAQLKNQIQHDYNQLITDQPTYTFVSNSPSETLSFQLFQSDQNTIQLIKSMEHPDKIFLDINHRYISWLIDMTDTITADQLGRDQSSHIRIHKLLKDLDYGVNQANKIFASQWNWLWIWWENKLLLTQSNTNNSNTTTSNDLTVPTQLPSSQSAWWDKEIPDFTDPPDEPNDTDSLSQAEIDQLNQWNAPQSSFAPTGPQADFSAGVYSDPTNQIQWYFAPPGPLCKDDPYFGACSSTNVCTTQFFNIIDREGKNSELYKLEPHKLSPSGPLVLHDDDAVFVKPAGDEYKNDIIFDEYYELPTFNSVEDLIKHTIDGYILIQWDWYKIWDHGFELYDFQAKGQNYDTLSFQWSHVWWSWYIIRVTDRVDIFPDKLLDNKQNPSNSYTFPTNFDEIKYIVVVPFGTDIDKLKLSVVWEFEWETIESLKTKKILLAIQYFKPQDKVISITLENLPKQRYYTQVRAMHTQAKTFLWFLFSPFTDSINLKTSTPRSTQQMWGMQIVSDNEPPNWIFNLVRKKTGSIEWTGLMLEWVIMTHYKIIGTWEDNGKIAYSWINHNGVLIKKVPGSRIELDDLYFTWWFNETYEFGAMDSAGMSTVEQIVMDVTIPTIEITNILGYSNKYAHIIAEISRDMDEGSVKFERLRHVLWTTMKDIDGVDKYSLIPWQTIVTWWLYELEKWYDLKDNSGHIILSIDATKPNIIIPPDQQWIYSLSTSINQGIVWINIVDTNLSQTIFTYYPVSQSLNPVNPIQIQNPNYTAIDISHTSNPNFNGWTCIAKIGWECEIIIDNMGNPVIPTPYSQTFNVQYIPGLSGSASYQFADSNQQPIVTLWVVLKPLD